MLPSRALYAMIFAVVVLLSAADAYILPSRVQKAPPCSTTRDCWSSRSKNLLFRIQDTNAKDDSLRSHSKGRWFHVFPSIKKVFPTKARRFVMALMLFMSLCTRTPTSTAAANASKARTTTTTTRTPQVKSFGSTKIIIQPPQQASISTSKSSLLSKPLVVVAGTSGLALFLVRQQQQQRVSGGKDEDKGNFDSTTEPSSTTVDMQHTLSFDDDTESTATTVGKKFNEVPSIEEEADSVEDDEIVPEPVVLPTEWDAKLNLQTAEMIEGRTLMESTSSAEEESLAEGYVEGKSAVILVDDKGTEELSRVLALTNEWKFLQEDAANTVYPLREQKFIEARRQPKAKTDAEKLAMKYGKISDTSERAYQILVDLGMVEPSSRAMDISKFEGIIDMDKQ